MTEEKQAEVFEIDLNKKYVLISKNKMSHADASRLKETIGRWMSGNATFLIIFDGDIELKKISEDDSNNWYLLDGSLRHRAIAWLMSVLEKMLMPKRKISEDRKCSYCQEVYHHNGECPDETADEAVFESQRGVRDD